MVEGLVVLEVNMQAILDTHLHLHRHNFSLPLHTLIGQQHCEILLFRRGKLVILQHNNPDEVPDPACDAIEGLILLLKVRKLEFVGLVLCHNASWFHFLGKRGELSRQILIRVYLYITQPLPKKPTR